MTIRIWYENQWREAKVYKALHDTVQVYEPGKPSSILNVARSEINPNDLHMVPIPSCRVRVNDEWEWAIVKVIRHEMVEVELDGELHKFWRTDIHTEDNRLMPPPTW